MQRHKKVFRYYFNSLLIDCCTWQKDSHGLFDYETIQVTRKYATVTEPCKIVRNNQEIIKGDRNQVIDKSDKNIRGLINIGIIRQNYYLYSLSNKHPTDEELWTVLRDYKGEDGHQGYKLQEGCIVKMGRCRYSLKKLVKSKEIKKSFDTHVDHQGNNDSISSLGNLENKKSEVKEDALDKMSQTSSKKPDENQCRICLTTENTPENPLIESPCLCTGSIRLVHSDCLKQWLHSKVSEKRTDFAVTYAWKDFECDICKSKYPSILLE